MTMKILNRRVMFGTPKETDEEIIADLEKMEADEAKAAKEEREAQREREEEKRYKPSKNAKRLHITAAAAATAE